MNLTALENAAQRGGGIVVIWVDSAEEFIQVNKYELLQKVKRDGIGFLQDHKCYRANNTLYIEPSI